MFKWFDRIPKLVKLKIYCEYRKHFSAHWETIELGEKTLASEPIIWDDTDNFLKLCICILAISLTRARSIYFLCRNGLAKDAVILLRVMFEDIISFNYIHNDKSRLQDFLDFDTYLRLKIGEIAKASKSEKVNIERLNERQSELEGRWGHIKSKFTYIDKKGKQQVYKKWTRNKTLEEISKELKAEETYNYLYRYLSNYVHLSPISFSDYVLGRDQKGVIIEKGASLHFIPEVLATSAILFLDALIKVINTEYSIGLDNEINKLTEEIKKLK